MESIKKVAILILCGVKDCILGMSSFTYFWSLRKTAIIDRTKLRTSKYEKDSEEQCTVFDVLMECFVFGVLFWTAIWVFHNVLLANIMKYLAVLLTPEEMNSISWLSGFFDIIFRMAWTMPLFFISRIMNYSWYQTVADLTFENTRGKKRIVTSFSYSLGDQIESTTIQCLFLLQGYVVFLLPVPELLKHVFSILHISLLYSLYAFEYKWVQLGWPLRKRLSYIDAKWPYFVGFGLPLAALTSFVNSYIESLIIFSTLFPIYVISSTVTIDSAVLNYCRPLRSFAAVTRISDFIFCNICKLIQS